MNRSAKICATCAHFRTDDYPNQKEHGLGRCTAYDQGDSPVIAFVEWDRKFTVLYRPAQNLAARRAFIAMMEEQEPKQGE